MPLEHGSKDMSAEDEVASAMYCISFGGGLEALEEKGVSASDTVDEEVPLSTDARVTFVTSRSLLVEASNENITTTQNKTHLIS